MNPGVASVCRVFPRGEVLVQEGRGGHLSAERLPGRWVAVGAF